ncbi:SRPBCC family protein [Krasilnikovia sp. MM14-A1004]|uniref:SRPBCC family protein n=1 Tax=Krasilnikovia sp. MM14-A1004 TaxID=3373541 RepID=UPI00399C6A6C
MSMVQQAIEIGAPLHMVYEQLATFENYPRFMAGVHRVTTTGDDQTHWVMDVDGHRREFDAQITECSLDERVSWSTMEGPLLAETITVRPLGEMRTQVVAQMEADIAYLMPSDRHGQETLNRRLKMDLEEFKYLIESGELAGTAAFGGASTKRLSGDRSDLASPASVAARIKANRAATGRADMSARRPDTPDEIVDITSAPGIHSTTDLDDVLAPGRRIAGNRPVRGGAAGTWPATGGAGNVPAGGHGSAPMGGQRMSAQDVWGDGMINEADRGGALDY